MEDILRQLLDVYEEAEQSILKSVADRLTDDEALDDTDWRTKKLQDIQRLRDETVTTLRKIKGLDTDAQKAIYKSYITGAQQNSKSFVATNTDAIAALTKSYLKELDSTRYRILRTTEDTYRRIIAQSTSQAVVGAQSRLQVAQRALNRFAAEGITGFTDSAGRDWDMRSYVEMATRTAVNNSFREGRLAGLADNNQDLIIVSAVPNPSPLCAPWERQILSISGDGNYPSLAEAQEAGLFHPNCRHSFTAYTRLTKKEVPEQPDNYEAVQRQREIESTLRSWKRREAVGDSRATDKVREWRDKLKEHTDTSR